MFLVAGCVEPTSSYDGGSGDGGGTDKEPVLVAELIGATLDEDYYYPYEGITISSMGKLVVTVNLYHWPGDYALEVFFMSYSDYVDYINYDAFAAWRKALYEEGEYTFSFIDIPPGNYVLVVDNTDRAGDTDFDLVNDYAVFDLVAYFEPY